MKPKIPNRIREREKLFKRLYREGLIHARRIRRTGYLSIRLSLYWRMLSKDNGLSCIRRQLQPLLSRQLP
ncbi:ParE family toxin-like protein [Symbiopectobacterium purcellii]|uniref:ParE family toxin-like protein n=1 Tax=Symbiopectobacterium purcellii TaxID=2871826 RepID=UPI003F8280B2